VKIFQVTFCYTQEYFLCNQSKAFFVSEINKKTKIITMADSANKRNIPIQFNRDFSVIDTEFSSIRERFDNEMKRMEDG
jgi:hypothetical protein